MGAARPTAEDKKEIAKEVAQDEQLHGNQTAKMKLHVRLPREFDARKHWPHCESIRTIQSQMGKAIFDLRLCLWVWLEFFGIGKKSFKNLVCWVREKGFWDFLEFE